MRIVFIHPNYHSGGAEIAGNWPPAWIAHLAGCLKAGGFTDVTFVDAMTHHLDDEQVRARIAEIRPDVVGCTAITPAIYEAERLLQTAKEVDPATVTGLRGIHGTFMCPQLLTDAPWIVHPRTALPEYPRIRHKVERRCMVGCLQAFAKSGVQQTFCALGRVGYWGPQSKRKADFHFDAARTAPRAAEAASADDDGWVTMHRGKIEHKARLEARAAESATAMACGGGREHLAEDGPRAAG